MHFGGIIVPPGYTDPLKFVDGNPYGASLVATPRQHHEFDDATANALDHLARRVVRSPADSCPDTEPTSDTPKRVERQFEYTRIAARRSR